MPDLALETIDADEAELRRVIAKAQADLEELAIVRRWLIRKAGPKQHQPDIVVGNTVIEVKQHSPTRIPGLKDLLIKALSISHDPWLTANQIQVVASSLARKEVKMSSISPKLTDLKTKGEIVRRDMHVALASRVGGVETPRDESREVLDVLVYGDGLVPRNDLQRLRRWVRFPPSPHLYPVRGRMA